MFDKGIQRLLAHKCIPSDSPQRVVSNIRRDSHPRLAFEWTDVADVADAADAYTRSFLPVENIVCSRRYSVLLSQ